MSEIIETVNELPGLDGMALMLPRGHLFMDGGNHSCVRDDVIICA